ncbi:hypothetical protein KEM56_006295, partial [Ascosphaera pollenicola]
MPPARNEPVRTNRTDRDRANLRGVTVPLSHASHAEAAKSNATNRSRAKAASSPNISRVPAGTIRVAYPRKRDGQAKQIREFLRQNRNSDNNT